MRGTLAVSIILTKNNGNKPKGVQLMPKSYERFPNERTAQWEVDL